MAEGIHITDLPEAAAADDNSFLAVANGTSTQKIKVSTYNATANATAQGYAQQAQAQAGVAQTQASAAAASAGDAALALSQVNTLAGQVSDLKTQAQTSASAAAASALEAAGEVVEIEALVAQAESLVGQIESTATLSQSYAVGGTGTRTGEDTDNAAYYARQAEGAAGGGVSSFNGRSGAVTPRIGDYTADTVAYETSGGAMVTTKQKIQSLEPVFGAATASAAGTKGMVPAPSAGDQDKALFGDGTWVDVSVPDMAGASASAAGTHGLVPAPAAGDQNKALLGDGTWGDVSVSDMVGATASAAGQHGLVPAPTIADRNKFLKGDGTYGDAQAMIDDAIGAYVDCAVLTVPAANWQQTTIDGATYYANAVAVTKVTDEHPDIFIAPATGYTFPTEAEQTAYNAVSHAIAGTTTVTFYASSAPATTFYVYARGVE